MQGPEITETQSFKLFMVTDDTHNPNLSKFHKYSVRARTIIHNSHNFFVAGGATKANALIAAEALERAKAGTSNTTLTESVNANGHRSFTYVDNKDEHHTR